MGDLLVAVDVGTGSARAGVFTPGGQMLGRADHPVAMRRPTAYEAEHDSEDIWRAVVAAIRGAMAAAGAAPEEVVGVGFDATCSLVVRSRTGAPLAVSRDGAPNWDTIVWLDHRAMAEAEECTASGHPVLDSLGGVMSPEMQLPKLMWVKRQLPDSWAAMGYAFDLVDFLTFRATGTLARSQSTLACKWGWGPGGTRAWPRDFFQSIGLADLIERARLPDAPALPGTCLGALAADAARELGLSPGVRVAAGFIDAHAGALGALGRSAATPAELDRHLCLVAGTSNSIIALAPEPRPRHGIWGPYAEAIVPGAFLMEAGQSATGALLDHLIRWHSAGGEPDATRHQGIADRIAGLRQQEGNAFGADLHVLPDFHGNRSPLADPAALGVVSGLSLDASFDSLCRLYWRTAVALALGVRQNLEALGEAGFRTEMLHLAGGHARNRLLVSLYADATGCTIIEPKAPDAVLLGSAMLAATAAGLYPTLPAAAAAMDQGGEPLAPDPAARGRYDRDYRVLLEMQRQRRALAAIP